MRAWWTFWALFALSVLVWIGVGVAGGRDRLVAMLQDPAGMAILLIPPALAGLNLILFSRMHEEVCRLEAERHSWLRAMVGPGYSARTFALTGAGLLAVVVYGVWVSLSRA